MAEYIERDAALREIERREARMVGDKRVSVDAMKSFIKNRPAVDVAPVVHGRWLNKKEWHLGRWVAWLECSCCGEHDDNAEMYEMLPFGAGPSNYCPNCGAKMDGGGGDAAD